MRDNVICMKHSSEIDGDFCTVWHEADRRWGSFAVERVDDGEGVQTAFIERVRSERIGRRIEKTSACNDQLVVGRRTHTHHHHVLVSVDLLPQKQRYNRERDVRAMM